MIVIGLFRMPNAHFPAHIFRLRSIGGHKLTSQPNKFCMHIKFHGFCSKNRDLHRFSRRMVLFQMTQRCYSLPSDSTPSTVKPMPGNTQNIHMNSSGSEDSQSSSGSVKQSKTIVIYALIGNLVITSAKLGAWLSTGSSGMLSEAVHSIVDCGNQLLLLIGTTLVLLRCLFQTSSFLRSSTS